MPASLAPVAALLVAVLLLQVGNALTNTRWRNAASWKASNRADWPARHRLFPRLRPRLLPVPAGGAARRPHPGVCRRSGGGGILPARSPLLPHPLVWAAVLRALMGLCFAGLFMVAESWLNERATGINRGQRFRIHRVLVYLGATLGQNLLGVRDVAAPDLFSIAAITLTLAPVPVAMTASTAPKPIRRLPVDLRWLAGISPLALTGCPLVGAVNGAIWSLAPIYAQSQGLAPNEVGWFMALLITGGAVSQSPVGKVSDRPDRRWMIIAVALISSAAGIALVVSCEGGLRLLADHLFPVRRACERHRRLRALRRGRERHAADVRDRRHRRATDRLRPDGGTRHGDAVRLCGHAAPRARSVLHLVLLQRPLAAERPTFVVTMPRTAPMPPNLDPRAEEGAEVVGGEEPAGEGTDAGRPARERRKTVP